MTLDFNTLPLLQSMADQLPEQRTLLWPVPGNPSGCINFDHFDDWKRFFLNLGLHPVVPFIVKSKFEQAQKLHLFAWFDQDLINAAELIAVASLELALQDCYGGANGDIVPIMIFGNCFATQRIYHPCNANAFPNGLES